MYILKCICLSVYQFNFCGFSQNEFDIGTNMLTFFFFFSGEEMLMRSRENKNRNVFV